MTEIVRETRETHVKVTLKRGTGEANVDTGIPFLDHMVRTFIR